MMRRRQEAVPTEVTAEALLMSAQAECLLLDLAELKQQVEATLGLRRASEKGNQIATQLQ